MPYLPERPEQNRPETQRHKPTALRRLLLCVSVLLILYGLVSLIRYGAEYFSSRRTTESLREIAAETAAPEEPAGTVPAETAASEEPAGTVPAETAAPAAEAENVSLPAEDQTAEDRPDRLPDVEYPNGYALNPQIQKLRKKSEYIIGWIKMDDLDEPVVYKDNEFFLNHDAMGNRNGNGAIFMDEDTSLLTRPYTIVLYGHNMKSGTMFGNLKKYEDFAYSYKHRFIQFDTLYEEGKYAVFAAGTISVTPGKSKYVNLTELGSKDRETRRNALNALIRRSRYESILDVNEEDQILLLVTCVGDDDERLIVAARRLREHE